MTDPAVPELSARNSWRWWAIGGVCLALVVVVVCLEGVDAVELLLFGWLTFPFRVVPRMTVDWPTALLGLVALVLLLAVGHRTGHWIVRQASGPATRLRWQTSLVGITLILLAFAAGTSLVAASHQVIWLLTGRPTRQISAGPQALGPIGSARYSAQQSQFRNNLKQIGLAVSNYSATCDALPPGGIVNSEGRLLHGWAIHVVPYLGAGYLAPDLDWTVPWNQPPNDRYYRCGIRDLIHPGRAPVFDAEGYGLSHMAGNYEVLRMTSSAGKPAPLRLQDITDGLEQTLLIGEAAGRFLPWGHPANVRDASAGLGLQASGFGGAPGSSSTLFLMCDGSVRSLNNAIEQKVLRELATPAGEEPGPRKYTE